MVNQQFTVLLQLKYHDKISTNTKAIYKVNFHCNFIFLIYVIEPFKHMETALQVRKNELI